MLIKITMLDGRSVRINPRAIDIVEPSGTGSCVACQHDREYTTAEPAEDLNARIERERAEYTSLHESEQAKRRPKDPKAKKA